MSDSNGHAVKCVLTRDQILAATDMRIEEVDVPEWGGSVFVRNLNGRARDKFESSRYKVSQDGKVELIHDNTRATLLALSLCDEVGTLLFSIADVQALGEKNGATLDRLFEVAQRLSGLRTKDAEEKLKNSKAAPSDSSSSN